MSEFWHPQDEIGGDGQYVGLNKRIVGDVCVCEDY